VSRRNTTEAEPDRRSDQEMYEESVERQRLRLEAKKQRALEHIVSEKDLRAKEFPKRRAIVEGLFHAGETGLLVGRPKAGKSRLAMQLAVCATRGLPFLNQHVKTKWRVLLLDLENGSEVVQARLKVMSPVPPADYDEDLLTYTPELISENDFTLSDDEGLIRLSATVSYTAAEILIVDTWRLLSRMPDENRAEHVVSSLARLDRLHEEDPNLSILLVHHLRKRDLQTPISLRTDPFTWVEGVSGHHALVGHVDFCWGLDREIDGKGNEAIIFGGVSRNAASTSILLDEDPETLLYSPIEATGAQMKGILTPKEAQYWDVAQALGEFTFSELVEACRTKARRWVASMLRKAKAQGRLRQSNNRYEVIG
jgi:hypothetical protein